MEHWFPCLRLASELASGSVTKVFYWFSPSCGFAFRDVRITLLISSFLWVPVSGCPYGHILLFFVPFALFCFTQGEQCGGSCYRYDDRWSVYFCSGFPRGCLMCKSIGRFPEKPRDAITTVLADKCSHVCMFSAVDLCSRPPAHHLACTDDAKARYSSTLQVAS